MVIFMLRVARQHLGIVLALVPGSLYAQENLFAIDSVGGTADDDSFGLIVEIAVSPEGSLAVAQLGLGEVWVFDADGKRQVVARSGEGPGEFEFVSGVAWRSDTLVVVDARRQLVTLMGDNGRYLRDQIVSSPAIVGYRPIGYLRSGLTLAAPQLSSGSTATAKPLLLVNSDGQVIGSLGEIRHRRVSVNATLASGKLIFFQHPLPNFTRAALSPDGRYFATADERESRDGSRLQFTLYDDIGNELGRTTVTVETDPTSDDDVLERASDLIEDLSRDLPVTSVRRSILNAVQRPDRLPVLSKFRLDNAGRLWVGSISKGGGVVWRAWSINGDLVTRWLVEPGLDVRQVHDRGAVAIRRDDTAGWRVIFLKPQGAK